MARSVVLASTPRCEQCRLAQRWCVCSAFQAITCPLEIDVLIHHREFMRPTSTGRLINRVMPASRRHLFKRETPPSRDSVVLPDKKLWILHPRGDAVPATESLSDVQVLLLDASWPEATRMSQVVAPWGRLVRLPAQGPSRYRLRGQQLSGNYCTIESLLFLLAAVGLAQAEAQLRLQFELHVYAGLRARGAKAAAMEYLATSPVRAAFPGLLEEFDRVRPDFRSMKGRERQDST